MRRRLPLDAIDSRVVFMVYAVIVGAVGVFIAFWGHGWISSPLNDPPWAYGAITRVIGAAAVAAACCASAFSRIADPVDRHRCLGWFVIAHFVVVIVAWSQGALRTGTPPEIEWAFFFLTFILAMLYGGWMHYGGDSHVPPFGMHPSLFGETPPSTLQLLRAQYEEQTRAAGAQEERNRLARDLHDSIKQQIFAIQTAAATAEARFQADPDGARQAIAQVRDSARESMAEMDAMLDHLRVAVIENTGLVEALKKQCEALQFRSGASVTFSMGALPPNEILPSGAHRALLRIAQEALSNVARHARATRVSVTLDTTGRRLQLKIEDNGAGYDTEAVRRGMGLDNMQARAAEYDGDIEITSRHGEGTTTVVSIPYSATDPKFFLKKVMWPAGVLLFLIFAVLFESSTRPPYYLLALLPLLGLQIVRYLTAWRRARKLRVGPA